MLNSSFGTGIGVHYWRERNREVDFVLQQGKSVVAIEVKEVTLGCALKKKSKRWLGIVVVFAHHLHRAEYPGLSASLLPDAFRRGRPAHGAERKIRLRPEVENFVLRRPSASTAHDSFAGKPRPACRGLSFAGASGVRLGAWYCPVSPDSPLVILFHGYAAEKTDTRNEAGVFLEMGLSVLLVDFRGLGRFFGILHDDWPR